MNKVPNLNAPSCSNEKSNIFNNLKDGLKLIAVVALPVIILVGGLLLAAKTGYKLPFIAGTLFLEGAYWTYLLDRINRRLDEQS